ncbi:MAG: hypothetical protein RR314_05025 [Oscillospiraceae bacterium]
MLIKLIKQEFAATWRIMGPIFAAALGISVLANFSSRLIDSGANDIPVLDVIAALIVVAFSFALVAVVIMSLVVMISRFRKNLLSDEGYLMHTLPVSVHSLVWAKLIVSIVWFFVTSLVIILAAVIVTFRVELVTRFFEGFSVLIRQLSEYGIDINVYLIGFEMLIAVIVTCLACCLVFYAAMSLGHSFTAHKSLLSVVFFFALTFGGQVVGTSLLIPLANRLAAAMSAADMFGALHSSLLFGIASELFYCAVCYVITTFSLKRRLNLD